MPDNKLTDNEIIKAKKLIEKLKEAYDFYYDVSRSMPYDIDTTLRESAICFANCLNEINRLQAKNEKLQKFKSYFDFYYGCDLEILGIDEDGNTTFFDEFYNCAIANAESIEHHIAHIIKTAKAEAYKEFAEKLDNKAMFPHEINDDYAVGLTTINNLLKELVGE